MRRSRVFAIALALIGGPWLTATAWAATPNYAAMKSAAAEVVARTHHALEVRRNAILNSSSPYAQRLNIGCGEADSVAGSRFGRRTENQMAEVARHAAYTEWLSRTLGYPASVWRPVTAQYESRALPIAKSATHNFTIAEDAAYVSMLKRLQGALMAYQGTHSNLPRVRALCRQGCGCGGVGAIRVVTQPVGGQVMIIPAFYYELCRVQNINPNDTAGCNHWREVPDQTVESVLGDYRYAVRWPDGSVRRGQLDFDKASYDKGRQMLTLTLRKP